MKELYETAHYKVVITDDAIGEDGKYGRDGYAVVNKETGVIEHTTTMLPGAMYQANHFNDTIEALNKTDEPTDNVLSMVGDVPDDVVPN